MNIRVRIKKIVYSEQYMVGFIISLSLALLLELTGNYFLMLLAGGVAGFFVKKGWLSFIIGFISVSLAWGYISLFLLSLDL